MSAWSLFLFLVVTAMVMRWPYVIGIAIAFLLIMASALIVCIDLIRGKR